MRTSVAILGAVLVAVLVAGCGDDTSKSLADVSSAEVESSSSSSSAPETTSTEADPTPVPAAVEPEPEPAEESGEGKYDSDWAKNGADTTCKEWSQKMTAKERFVMIADFMAAVDEKLPKDAVVNDFVVGVSTACKPVPTMTVGDVSATMMLMIRG